ncbi:MAG: FimV/HubP family polar landmark protein [Pseudomonadota bacterium]
MQITSLQPVNEPFVTLLVEVAWPSGRLMREYTFLLDPVGFIVEPQAETVTPIAPVVTTPPVLNEPLPVPDVMPEAAVAPAAPEVSPDMASEPAVAEEPPAPEAAATEEIASMPSEPVAQEAPVVVEDALSKEEAIPVSENVDIKVVRGDSLSKIALKVKPADVSLERMLVAMYRANSNAFMGKNMNRLKAGKIIRIPDAAEIEAVEQAEAVKVYRAQVEDWNAYRQQLAAVRAEAREQTAQQGTSGKVTAAVTENAAGKEAPKEVLKLSKGEAPGDGVAGGSASSKEEESVAKAKALKEAQDRTALLEKNVKDLERLAELKKQQAEAAQKSAPAPDADVATASIGASAPAPAKPVAKPAVPAPVEVPQAEVSLVDSLLEDPVLLGGGVAGLLALLGAGFWLSRRRGKPAPDKTVAAIASENGDIGSSTGRIAEPVMPSPDTGDFTQQADDTNEERSSDEVDPIAEADLFLTFGRDVQAEEVLKEALNSRPGDVQIMLKLLSIYSTRKDANAFMTYARQIKDGGDEAAWLQAAAMGRELEPSNPFYGGEGVAEAASPEVEEAAVEPAVDFDLGFGTSSPDGEESSPLDTMKMDTSEIEKTEEKDPAEDFLGTVVMQPQAASSETTTILSAEDMQAVSEGSMDFDITGAQQESDAESEANAPKEVSSTEPEASDDLIFDVTSTHSGVPSQTAVEETGATEEAAASDDLVFDVTATHPGFQSPVESANVAEPQASEGLDDLMFDVTSSHAEESEAAPAAAEAAAPAVDDGLAFTLDIPDEAQSEEEKPSAPLDIGLGDISLNLDTLGGSEEPSPASEMKDERWQEVATKLDLAKAYQEMGDGAGAKEILEEVMRDGDEEQRASAQSILDQL